jgi:diadenosine tetraphosphate (Ap4A) HIT family hydrolase
VPDDAILAQFRDTFRLDDLTVTEQGGWVLSVRPAQLKLGAMVVSVAAGQQRFQDLTTDDGAGYIDIVATAERLAQEVYGAVRINVVALMMKDPVVHYHVLPRYDTAVDRHGTTWTDDDWPGPPTFGPASTDDQVLFAIRDELRTAL